MYMTWKPAFLCTLHHGSTNVNLASVAAAAAPYIKNQTQLIIS